MVCPGLMLALKVPHLENLSVPDKWDTWSSSLEVRVPILLLTSHDFEHTASFSEFVSNRGRGTFQVYCEVLG